MEKAVNDLIAAQKNKNTAKKTDSDINSVKAFVREHFQYIGCPHIKETFKYNFKHLWKIENQD